MNGRVRNRNLGQGLDRTDRRVLRKDRFWRSLGGLSGERFDDGPFPRNGFQSWRKAMAYEGSRQVGFMRRLFELRSWYKLVPDQSVVASGFGDGEDHVQAARAEDGSFLIAYLPQGHVVGIHMAKISGKKIKARWYDPREGTWREIGEYANSGTHEFVAPSQGDRSDWILVLDDAEKGYPTERFK